MPVAVWRETEVEVELELPGDDVADLPRPQARQGNELTEPGSRDLDLPHRPIERALEPVERGAQRMPPLPGAGRVARPAPKGHGHVERAVAAELQVSRRRLQEEAEGGPAQLGNGLEGGAQAVGDRGTFLSGVEDEGAAGEAVLRPQAFRQREEHGDPGLHVAGAAPDDAASVPGRLGGAVPRNRVDVSGQEKERTAGDRRARQQDQGVAETAQIVVPPGGPSGQALLEKVGERALRPGDAGDPDQIEDQGAEIVHDGDGGPLPGERARGRSQRPEAGRPAPRPQPAAA